MPSLGTNNGAEPLAFQSWHRFKEAFPPELIQRVLGEEREIPESCLDPFGGSGTTALASQFLGVSSTTIEVDPFLVDVIRAKVESYDSDLLVRDFGLVCRRAAKAEVDPTRRFGVLPPASWSQAPAASAGSSMPRWQRSWRDCSTQSKSSRPPHIGASSRS